MAVNPGRVLILSFRRNLLSQAAPGQVEPYKLCLGKQGGPIESSSIFSHWKDEAHMNYNSSDGFP